MPRKKVQQQRRNNSTSNDAMMSSSHTNTSTMSASAILDRRRPLQEDSDKNTGLRPESISAIDQILGIEGNYNKEEPKVRNKRTSRTKRSSSRRSEASNSASPVGRRQSNQRRLPSISSFQGPPYNDTTDSEDEEEVDLNDRIPPRQRKQRRSKTAAADNNEARKPNRKDGPIDRNTQSLSPSLPNNNGGYGKKREKRKPRVESVSSLSASDGEGARRSRMRRQQIQERELSTISQSQRTDDALKQSLRTDDTIKSPQTSQSLLSSHAAVRSASRRNQNNKASNNNNKNHIAPAAPYHHQQPFQSPTGTRGTVSPLSSPSNHDVSESISPLTTSTETFLTGPIRMHIPWAKESDMGGVKKEPRNNNKVVAAVDDEGAAEAEDSFEMEVVEPSREFRELLEVDSSPRQPNRLSSIRSINWKERHLRSSYPHELDMYKARSPTNADYMPNQPSRPRGSSIATNSMGRVSMFEGSSMGSFSLARSSMGTTSTGRVSMFENSHAHELDLYKAENNKGAAESPTVDTIPMRPTRLASMHSIKKYQSSGSFSIGTFDTEKDGELKPADDTKVQKEESVDVAKVGKKKKKKKKKKSVPVVSDEIESLESEGEESIRSLSPSPKEESEQSSPLRAPHTVGATVKKRTTLFLSPLSKLSMPKSPGSLRATRTFGRKKKVDANGVSQSPTRNGDKGKSWLPALGNKNGSKHDRADNEGSKRLGRTEEVAKEQSPREQSPSSLSGIKKAFQNRRARSMSPHGVRAASKKIAGRTKRNKQKKW